MVIAGVNISGIYVSERCEFTTQSIRQHAYHENAEGYDLFLSALL